MKGLLPCLNDKMVLITARAIIASVFTLTFLGLFLPAVALGASLGDEKKAILAAAKGFLDAEMRQDYPAVYRCFAPSSPYARAHTYEAYLQQALASEDHMLDYKIVKVSYVLDNDDKRSLPAVEKLAQVEVEVTFLHTPTQQRTKFNIGFIFFKEAGGWYKS